MLGGPARASIETARTFLFVPADDVRKCERAWAAGADALIFDLEDAVAPHAKASAREWLASNLPGRAAGPVVAIRINAPETPDGALDLETVAQFEGIHALVVPKASPESLAMAADAVPAPLVALAETADGILHAERLARARRVARLMFGPFDLSAELGCEPGPDGTELLLARSQLVLASAAAGIAAPIDGPFTALDAVDELCAETERARRLGFGAKACIHPRQLPEVAAGLAPRVEQVEWARRVIAAYSSAAEVDSGVVSLDGQMIDEPMARRARAVLAEVVEEE
jgi:citrate lyase subunit beta/citryl-CoA lyase